MPREERWKIPNLLAEIADAASKVHLLAEGKIIGPQQEIAKMRRLADQHLRDKTRQAELQGVAGDRVHRMMIGAIRSADRKAPTKLQVPLAKRGQLDDLKI